MKSKITKSTIALLALLACAMPVGAQLQGGVKQDDVFDGFSSGGKSSKHSAGAGHTQLNGGTGAIGAAGSAGTGAVGLKGGAGSGASRNGAGLNKLDGSAANNPLSTGAGRSKLQGRTKSSDLGTGLRHRDRDQRDDYVETVHITQPKTQDLGGRESGSWAKYGKSSSGSPVANTGIPINFGKGTSSGLGNGDHQGKGSGDKEDTFATNNGGLPGFGWNPSGLGPGDHQGKGGGNPANNGKNKNNPGTGPGGTGGGDPGSGPGGNLGPIGGGPRNPGGGTGNPNPGGTGFPHGPWGPNRDGDPWRTGNPSNPDPNNPNTSRNHPPQGRPAPRPFVQNPPPPHRYRDNGHRGRELTDEQEFTPYEPERPKRPEISNNDDNSGGGSGATACPATTALAAADSFPEGAFGNDTSIPGGCYEHENGKVKNPTSTGQIPPMQWPFNIPGYSIEGSTGAFGQKGNSLDKQIPKQMKHGLPPTAAEVAAAGSQLISAATGAMAQPNTWLQAAKEVQNTQTQQNADTSGDMAKNQAGCALDFCRTSLENFTVNAGNKWNKLRNELFLPMAVLLLLPGAVATQAKATVAQGFPIFGEVSPIEGIYRSIVSIFLIPGTYLIVNYGIDVSNSISFTIQSEYRRIFGTDMYRDAMCAQIRAYGVRLPSENLGHIPGQPGQMQGKGKGPRAKYEGKNLDVKLEDPCAGLYEAPQQKANEKVPYVVNSQRAAYNGMGSALAMTWNILCAFQMCYLYYLWFVGPIMAALWVWPVKQLREAFPNWCEGVITICFWSLFWNTTVLLMACFRGIDDTGTVIMSALNFLSTACVKFAFDFAGLVKAAGAEAGKMAEKAGKGGGGKGGGGGGGSGSGKSSGGSPQHKGGNTPHQPSPGNDTPRQPDVTAAQPVQDRQAVMTSDQGQEKAAAVVGAPPQSNHQTVQYNAGRTDAAPTGDGPSSQVAALPVGRGLGGDGISQVKPDGITAPPSDQQRTEQQTAEQRRAEEDKRKQEEAKKEEERTKNLAMTTAEMDAKLKKEQADPAMQAQVQQPAADKSNPVLAGGTSNTTLPGSPGSDTLLSSNSVGGNSFSQSFQTASNFESSQLSTNSFSRDSVSNPPSSNQQSTGTENLYRQASVEQVVPTGQQQVNAEMTGHARGSLDPNAVGQAIQTATNMQSPVQGIDVSGGPTGNNVVSQARDAIGDVAGSSLQNVASAAGGPQNIVDLPPNVTTTFKDVAGGAVDSTVSNTQMAKMAAAEEAAILQSSQAITSQAQNQITSEAAMAMQMQNTIAAQNYAKESHMHADPVITNSSGSAGAPPLQTPGGMHVENPAQQGQTVYRQQNQEIVEERRQPGNQPNVREQQQKQMQAQQKWFDKMSKAGQHIMPPSSGGQPPPQSKQAGPPPSTTGKQSLPPQSETKQAASETLSDVVSRGSTLRRSRDITDMSEEEIELMKKLGHEESKPDGDQPPPQQKQ